MSKHIVLIAISIMSLGFLSGCNTAEGFGRDLQNAGRAIDDAIE